VGRTHAQETCKIITVKQPQGTHQGRDEEEGTKHVAKTQNEKGRRRAEWERRGDDL